MNEKIKENPEGVIFSENKSERVEPMEKIEDTILPQKKEELLSNIYKKEETKVGVPDVKNSNQEKTVSLLIKESLSLGVEKTVKKTKKLGAYVLDMFHDELTKKNKSDKK
jgi:hypothetical protein